VRSNLPFAMTQTSERTYLMIRPRMAASFKSAAMDGRFLILVVAIRKIAQVTLS
jgi:hypothetical protein